MREYPTRREENLNAAYQRGHANALDILKDSFGGEIPKELDLVNPPQYDVKFEGMIDKPGFWIGNAFKTLKSHWLTMGLSQFVFHTPLATAAIFLSSMALKTLSTKGYVTRRENDVINMNDIWGLAAHVDPANGPNADVLAHEHTHLLQIHDEQQSLSSSFDDDRTGLSQLFSEESGFVKYLSSEYEMQARLSTVISNAYVQHRHMPTNKYELWACLASQGLEPPPEVIKRAKDDPRCAAAFTKFPQDPDYIEGYADKAAVKDLGRVQESLADNPAGMVHLWDKAYPFLYGDLLEIMGDRQGVKRMGFDHNIQLREMFMRAAKDDMDGTATPKQAFTRMQKAAAMMPADDAIDLMKQVATGGVYKVFNDEAIFIPMGALRASAVFALAGNPGIPAVETAHTIRDVTGMMPRRWMQEMEQAERYLNAKPVQASVPITRTRPWESDMRANPFGAFTA